MVEALGAMGPNMEQIRQTKRKIVGIDPVVENDAVDVFEQDRFAAEQGLRLKIKILTLTP